MKSEKGFTLVEIALALALLGVVAAALLSALATGSRAILIADERATADSLARTQIEYVRDQPYSAAPWNYTVTSSNLSSTDEPDWWTADPPSLLSSDYETYTAKIDVQLIHALDDGLQRITVLIEHAVVGETTKEIFTLVGYRSLR
jgi:prepilin-type N-terminal cleavage/methylation domain-containing protein